MTETAPTVLGDPRLPARFWDKVRENPSTGCWEWTAHLSPDGYARITFGAAPNRKPRDGHRVAFEELVAPVPDGLVIDHLCRVRHCVNPAHMEPVTVGVNTARGLRPTHVTHCYRGHPYDAANTYFPPGGGRNCRECRRMSSRAWKARRKAVAR